MLIKHEQISASGGDQDFLDKLPEEGKKKKSDELVLTGIYLQPDLDHILDNLGKKGWPECKVLNRK